MFKCLKGLAPAHLSDLCVGTAAVPGRSGLRSAARGDLVVLGHRTEWGSRSFDVAGPKCWNKLPVGLRYLWLVLRLLLDTWRHTCSELVFLIMHALGNRHVSKENKPIRQIQVHFNVFRFQIGQPFVELLTEKNDLLLSLLQLLSHIEADKTRSPAVAHLTYLSRSCIPHLGNRGQTPPSFCFKGTPYHTSNQDTSLRGQEASVSPGRLCGTPCPMTLEIQNSHWNMSRLDWRLT